MLDNTILKFSDNPQDHFSIDDALKGISIIGGTGSGKTSGSGKTIAKQFLKLGWGGLVLCAKTDEADTWRQYCRDTGREQDLVIFGNNSTNEEGERIVFNPIDYETKREGDGAGETLNLTNIFMNIYRMGNRISGEGETKEERYWDTALKRCLNRVIELIKLSGEDLTYQNMVRLLTTTNGLDEQKYFEEEAYLKEHEDFSRIEKPENYCLYCLIKAFYSHFADDMEYSQEEHDAYDLVYNYFLIDMPNMGDRTKSVVTESFMGLAEPFLSGVLKKHFSGVTNLYPEWSYQQNKIIVLNFPVKEYLESGIIAQSIFKLLFQQSVERRDINKYPAPIFLWADEAQYFINPYDQVFLTTARSSRVATVFLSQNIPNYMAAMGSGNDAAARVDSLMGNLSTKIFHANSDAKTNEYASRLIGNDITEMRGQSSSQSYINMNFQRSSSKTEQYLPQVRPKDFTLLKNGGRNNDFEVEAIIFVTGKLWSSETNFIKTTFDQEFNSAKTTT